MIKNKILIIGASGFIGKYAYDGLKKKYDVIATYNKHSVEGGIHFDASSMDIEQVVDLSNVSVAILLYGLTKPAICYNEKIKSTIINVDSTKRIIDSLVNYGIKIIYTSTQYVFDGKMGNYHEDDITSPSLLYGEQKLLIENYIREKSKSYIILRLDKVVSENIYDNTIFKGWIENIHKSKEIYCSTDQMCSPIDIKYVVRVIEILINSNKNGIYHVSSNKRISRIDILKKLIEEINKYKPLCIPIIEKKLKDFNGEEKLPVDTSLNSDKLIKDIGVEPPNIDTITSKIAKNYVINKTFFDSNFVYEDINAKTKSFYCRNDIVGITNNMVYQLLMKSKENNNCDIRLCVHKNNNELMHSMIIILHNKNHYKPHYHKKKSETYHLIAGEMDIYIFNDEGKIINIDTLSEEKNIIYRMPENIIHAIVPISKYVIFNEFKNGPFIRSEDSVFPNWDYEKV